MPVRVCGSMRQHKVIVEAFVHKKLGKMAVSFHFEI